MSLPRPFRRPRPRPLGRLGLLGLGALVPVLYGAVTLAEHERAVTPAGGRTTVEVATSHAFSLPAANLDAAADRRHRAGDRVFSATFVPAPAEVQAGLGPLYNQNSCLACHARDGRTPESLVLRVSLPGRGPGGVPADVPGVGTQLQTRAVFGETPEGRVTVTYRERPVPLVGGHATLRVPTYRIEGTARPLPAAMQVSPRTSRPVVGLGLLEAVPEATLYGLAAAQAEGGEVSGRVNTVIDPATGTHRAGRFGWKAGQPTLLAQAAAAFHEDMGLTTSLFPDAPDADGPPAPPEVADRDVEAVAFYTQTLAVPARRGADRAEVRHGERLFRSLGCASCHAPWLETGPHPGVPAVAHQTIAPYTDLLLHDMGAALADGRPEAGASGREWRTPPLWGVGLTEAVNGRPGFLHDGRARTFTEAVLWHGGEAAAARDRFRRLSPERRAALLAFLRSL